MSIDDDAARFGGHFEGGWQLGLLVARNVYKRAGAGRPPKSEQVRIKVSPKQFAEKAGVSDRTVQLYYDTWQLAAEEGHCTPAEKLSPGDDDPLLPASASTDHHELWRKFYTEVRHRKAEKANASRSNKRRQSAQDSPDTDNRHETSDNEAKANTEPTEHALYPLLLAVNRLTDELKNHQRNGGSVASLIAAAKEAASNRNRAALARVTGAL